MATGFHFGVTSSRDLSARVSADQAKSRAQGAVHEVAMLRGEIERLLMITEALWLLLKQEHGYSDENLVRQVQAIDLRDGELDGRVAPNRAAAKCPQCERPLAKNRAVCIYCGAALERGVFDR